MHLSRPTIHFLVHHCALVTNSDPAENWVNVPTNSMLTIHRQTVMVHPILDKYYERDPYHVRSSAFVQTKGLVSNEKAPSGSLSPASLDSPRKMLSQSLCSRSLSPDLARRSFTPVSSRESRLTSQLQMAQNTGTPPR